MNIQIYDAINTISLILILIFLFKDCHGLQNTNSLEIEIRKLTEAVNAIEIAIENKKDGNIND